MYAVKGKTWWAGIGTLTHSYFENAVKLLTEASLITCSKLTIEALEQGVKYISQTSGDQRILKENKICKKPELYYSIWNYNSKIPFLKRMTPIVLTNDQNVMRRVIWGYIFTLEIKIRINVKLETFLSLLIYQKNLVVRVFIYWKKSVCLVNDENL